MSGTTPPIRGPFFEAEVELPHRNTNLPAVKLPLRFRRTTTEWASWVARMASAVGFPIQSLTTTASLNYGSISANSSADLTVTLEGVKANDPQPVVCIGIPSGVDAGLVFHGFVSADDEVTVRASNVTTGAINPAAFTFRVEVRRYAA